MLATRLIFAAAIICATPVTAQDPATTATTAAVLGQLRTGVDNIMTDAMQNADLMKFRVGTEMREMIDKWEASNAGLLDKAFTSLNSTQRSFFTNTQSQIDQVKQATTDSLNQLESISLQVAQTTNDIPLVGKNKVRIVRVRPSVLAPGAGGYRDIVVSGLSLDDGDPQLKIRGAEVDIPRIELLQSSAKFRIRPSDFLSADGKLTSLAGYIEYVENPNSWFFKKKRTRDVAFWVLPPVLAKYAARATIQRSTREQTTAEVHASQVSGRNKNINVGVRPPTGWKVDLTRADQFSVRGNGGEAGRCQKVDESNRSEEGVEIQTRVDAIKKVSIRGVKWKDGYINCIATLPIYRNVTSTVQSDLISGDLSWNTAVKLPAFPGTTGWSISFSVVDGRKVEFLGSGSDRYFSVQTFGGDLVITPNIPADL